MESQKGKKETVYTFIGIAASKIFTYILLIALANLFIKEIYGKAAFVISIFDLSVVLGSIGVPYILSPWISKKKDVHSIFWSFMILSLVFMTAGIIISLKHLWILPIVLLYPILFLKNIGGSYLLANFKYHINQLAAVLYILFTLIFVYLFRGSQTVGIIRAYTIGYFASAVVVIFYTRKDIASLISRFKINLSTLKPYLKKSLIASLLFISFMFLKWIDTSILGLLSTFESVASYSVAAPIANSVTVLSIPLSFYLLSKIPSIKNKIQSVSILKTILRLSFSLSLLALIVINATSHLIIKIFFPKYIGVEIYIMLLSIGMLFYALYGPVYYYLLGELNPKIGASSIMIAAGLNVVLDIILIPRFDIYGIAIATSIAHLTAFTMLFKKLNILTSFYPVYFTTLFVIISYYLGYYGLLLILIAIPMIVLTGLFKRTDYDLLKNSLKSMATFK